MRILVMSLVAAFLIFIFSFSAVAADNEALIKNVNIAIDGNIVSSFVYNSKVSSYTLYLPESASVDISVYAARDTVLLSAGGSKQYGTLHYTKQITDTHTIITINAKEDTSQTIAISFFIIEPEDDEPNVETPNPDNTPNNPNPDLDSNPNTDSNNNNNSADDPNNSSAPQADNSDPNLPANNNLHQTGLLLQIGNPIMKVNGEDMLLGTAPWIMPPGHTLVPVRFIAESLGGVVNWNSNEQLVEIWLDGQYFFLHIGEIVPGTNVSAMIKDSRTFVPLRYVMESFGASVEWIPEGQFIFIIYPAY